MIDLKQYDNSSFDRGAGRLKEFAWLFVKALCFLLPLPFPNRMRVVLLRGFGAKIGTGVVVREGVNITFPWNLTVGDHVWIGSGVTILSLSDVFIGSNCCVSQQAYLCTGSHNFRRETFDLIVKPIRIEDGSWIAARVFVGPGVRIGPAGLCAAGAVVIRDVGPGASVGGNPARPIQL